MTWPLNVVHLKRKVEFLIVSILSTLAKKKVFDCAFEAFICKVWNLFPSSSLKKIRFLCLVSSNLFSNLFNIKEIKIHLFINQIVIWKIYKGIRLYMGMGMFVKGWGRTFHINQGDTWVGSWGMNRFQKVEIGGTGSLKRRSTVKDTEHIMTNAGLDEVQGRTKTVGEMSVTSDVQMTPPWWKKAKKN